MGVDEGVWSIVLIRFLGEPGGSCVGITEDMFSYPDLEKALEDPDMFINGLGSAVVVTREEGEEIIMLDPGMMERAR